MYQSNQNLYEKSTQPLHCIDPSKKGKDWCLDYQKYIYSRRTTDNKISFLRSFAEGKQDSSRYQTLFDDFANDQSDVKPSEKYTRSDDNSPQKSREGYMHVNYDDIFSPAPVYINSFLGIMEEQEHKIVAFAQNENAGDERETMKYMSLVKKDFGEWADTVKTMMGISTDNEDQIIPKSLDEFKMFEMMGAFKLPYEIALEKTIDFTFDYSNWREVRRKILKDLFTLNRACVIDKVDSITRLNKMEYIDIDDTIVEYNNADNFDKTSFFAYVKYYSIQDLRSMCDASEELLLSFANKYSGKLGNPITEDRYERNEYGGWGYDSYRVPVLHSYWFSTDSEYTTIRKKNNSFIEVKEEYRSKIKPPKMRKSDNQQTIKHDSICVYQSSWCIDTDFVFDYGKMYNQSFDFENKRPKLPCHLFKLEGKSKVESMIPVLDMIEQTYLKLQNDISVAPPSNAMRIDINALSAVSFNNKKWSTLELIKLYTTTGKLLYKGTAGGALPPQMHGSQSTPIEAIPQNYEYVVSAGNTFNMCFQQLAVLTGIDQFTMASKTPASGTTATGINVASAATSNTLKPLYFGLVQIQQSIAYSVGYRVQLQLMTDEVAKSKYTSIIGRPLVNALITAAETEPIELGIKIEPMPTEQLKSEIRNAAMAALQNNKEGIQTIKYSEYLFVTTELFVNSNINYIRAWLMQREAIAEQKRNEFAKMNVDAQAEAQTKSALAINQDKRVTEKMLSDLRIRENYFKSLYDTSFKAMLENPEQIDEIKGIALDPTVMASFEPQQPKLQQGQPQQQGIPKEQEGMQENIQENSQEEPVLEQ